RSVAWSAACFVALHVGAIWAVHDLFTLHGPWAWLADLMGTVGASLLAFWLFLPVAAAVGTLYLDRIAAAVERRFYPWLPPGNAASLAEQAWDGIAVALRVLAFNVLALVLALLLPGIGLVLGWLIASYAIGRGLFVAVAMRRMPRGDAEWLYRMCRVPVLVQGGILALGSYVPLLNLLLPLVGTAAMVHVLDSAMTDLPHRQQGSVTASW
ncbi:MAG TPA: EI24 domain-containing protein, partial [Rhodopila sp.]|nr:EI24 domain-containing protein [Rhodopila sp.]